MLGSLDAASHSHFEAEIAGPVASSNRFRPQAQHDSLKKVDLCGGIESPGLPSDATAYRQDLVLLAGHSLFRFPNTNHISLYMTPIFSQYIIEI